jgi:hypothetical protein
MTFFEIYLSHRQLILICISRGEIIHEILIWISRPFMAPALLTELKIINTEHHKFKVLKPLVPRLFAKTILKLFQSE